MTFLTKSDFYRCFRTGTVTAGISFIGLLTFISCTNKSAISKTTISVTSLKRQTLDTNKSLTLLKIVKTYPALTNCDKTEKYTNLYICTKWSTGDTTYVFETCQPVDKFALDTSFGYPIAINAKDLTIQYPDNVTVFVPVNFKIPTDSKYLFAHVGYLTEY